jgi:hypothetical protein
MDRIVDSQTILDVIDRESVGLFNPIIFPLNSDK